MVAQRYRTGGRSLLRRWGRRLRRPVRFLESLISSYLAHGCVTHGAALAFYALFVLVPVPIFALSGAAALVGGDLARADFVDIVRDLAGSQMASTLDQALEGAEVVTAWRGVEVFGIASIVFGATAFFVELQETLNKIWGIPLTSLNWRGFLRARLASFLMVTASGLVLLALTVLRAVMAGFGDQIHALVPGFTLALGAVGFVVSLAIIAGLFSLVFRYVPDAKVTFRDVWLGSLVTALLFLAGNGLIGVYLSYSRLATAYGAAGSLVLTLSWIYYSAMAFLFGAELTRLLRPRRSLPT